jgi:PEP-CTERM motif
MKRLLLLAVPLLVVLSYPSLADTIISLYPNEGAGGNFGFLQRDPGFSVGVGGGTDPNFFNIGPYEPGTTLFGFSVDVNFDGGGVVLGGVSHELGSLSGTLLVSSITLPTNGKDFTTTAVLDFGGSGVMTDTGDSIAFGGFQIEKITFYYDPAFREYFPSAFTTTPEPTTFLLLGTGLAGIGWRKSRLTKA